jgi:hypothetical protein
VRPLYFVFSSSSRAPSSAATLGEKYKDELGKRTNEQRKDWTGRTRTEIQIQKTRKNTESKKNKTECRRTSQRERVSCRFGGCCSILFDLSFYNLKKKYLKTVFYVFFIFCVCMYRGFKYVIILTDFLHMCMYI